MTRQRYSWIRLLAATALSGGILSGQEVVYMDVTEAAGLLRSHGEIPDYLELNGSDAEFYGSAAAAVDVDLDGWTDLYVTRHDGPDRLYRNNGDGTFTDILPGSGLEAAEHANGVVWADFDNDGDPDLFANSLKAQRHYYFLNNGDGSFEEVAQAHGAAVPVDGLHHGMSVSVGDVDRDGWLDLFTTEWGVDLSEADPARHMVLLRNRGAERPGRFVNDTERAGLVITGTRVAGEQNGFSAMLSDFDGDGWPDLGVVADFGNSQLFWNRGNGTFAEGTDGANVGTDQNGMGSAVADYDQDGDLDWFVTAIDGSYGGSLDGNRLYRYEGGRQFRDVTDAAGVRDGGWAWGAAFLDADNDGDLDLVQANGFTPAEADGEVDPHADTPRLWIQGSDGQFTEKGEEAGLTDTRRGQGVVVFDYDRDGDLDVFQTSTYGFPVLYRNDSDIGDNRWLRIRLKGTLSNRDGIGARVVVEAGEDGVERMREFSPHNGYLAQRESVLHFGLGEHEGTVHQIRVRWPSGVEQTVEGVESNQVLTITEPADAVQSAPEIVQAPQPVTVERDQPLVLEVTATGQPAPVYQWFRDGEPLDGQSGPRLRLEKMRPYDAANYHVEVSNPLGSVRTEPVRVEYAAPPTDHSVARQWNEILLDAIRVDYPDPTVHSRNLFHVSTAMWDAYVAYDPSGELVPYLVEEEAEAADIRAAREEAISYAVYRILKDRYIWSPNYEYSEADFDAKMAELGYDPDKTSLLGDEPWALGNRIAARVLAYGWRDGANERDGYLDVTGYESVNEPLIFKLPGAEVVNPNRWQPLSFDFRVLQNGIPVGASTQHFLGLNWGGVRSFSLPESDHGQMPLDPGPPPYLGGEGDAAFKEAALEVLRYSALLDPRAGETKDISPGAYYNHPLGTNDGTGYAENPFTGEPYDANVVNLADYGRVVAEYWADGPDSETPPGHWNTIANRVTDRLADKRLYGSGRALDDLGWDVHLYFALNAALHDAAVAGWGSKRYYDYVRPVTLIRYMAQQGQSSDPEGPFYHPEGLPLEDGLAELITSETVKPGRRHEHLSDYVGEIAVRTWVGEPADVVNEIGGVGWIRAVEWMPYQRFSFVTPPFAAYVSGHSTFSRAAAEVMTAFTGSPWFPGGLETRRFSKDSFLHFERGPSETITLTWAQYRDAADEAGVSRLYGGIHVRADDFAGRRLGKEVGVRAWEAARKHFAGTAEPLSRTIHYADFRGRMEEAGLEETGPSEAGAGGKVPNLLRFVLGTEVEETGAARLPELVPLAGGDEAGLRFRMPAGLAGLRLELGHSDELSEWGAAPFAEAVQAMELKRHGEVEVLLRAPERARFLQLRVHPEDGAAAESLP